MFGRGFRTAPVDGDTFRLNARLSGVDAYERGQQMRLPDGSMVPIGEQAQRFIADRVGPNTQIEFLGDSTYGRPVARFTNGADDVGEQVLRGGFGRVTPEYLSGDPERLARYQAAEAYARSNRLGGWAGNVASPSDYRHQRGDATGNAIAPAPLAVGRMPMTAQQQAQFGALIGDPALTGDRLNAWASTYGQPFGNANGLASFARRNPGAAIRPEFVGTQGETPEQAANRPGIVTRHLASLNEGIADTLGAPVDLAAMGTNLLARGLGLPEADAPFLGSRWLRENVFHPLGIGLIDDRFAPQSGAEGYTQAFARGVGQAAVPAAGQIGIGGRLALAAPSAANGTSAARIAVRDLMTTAARNPGVTVAGEVGAGVGANVAGELASNYAPGNPYAQLGAQVIGGFAGGVAAGTMARPRASATPDAPLAVGSDPVDPALAVRAGDEAATPALASARPVPPGVVVEGVLPDGSRYGRRADGSAWGEVIGTPEPEAPIEAAAGAADGGEFRDQYARAREAMAGDGGDVIPPPPEGFTLLPDPDPAGAGPAMPMTIDRETLAGPRVRDVIDINAARPMRGPMTGAQRAALEARIAPADVLPIPGNTVRNVDEAIAAVQGRYEPVRPPHERSVLTSQHLPAASGNRLPHRGPVDLVTWLRSQGGLRDMGGELRHIGVNNSRRTDDFARGDSRFGQLVHDKGMDLDSAANSAWEAGFFPELDARPTIDEFLTALRDTWDGSARRFRPEDWPELQAFDEAQSLRMDAGRAAADGAPMVYDRGQPVGLDDLEAMAPPPSAYEEWPDGGPDLVGNIRVDRLDTPQDIARALDMTHRRVGGFDHATRGRIAQAETQRLSQELGMTPDSLIARRRGQAFNAEEALAARQILARSANDLVNLARRVQRVDAPGDELLADFQRALTRHVAIQEQVAGATAEAGRALAQFRMMADSRNVTRNVLTATVQSGGGADRLRQVADVLLEAEGNGGLNRAARDALRPGLSDKLQELWYNSLLSGPQTHVVNVVSNTLTSLGQLPEHAVAAAIGFPRRLLGSGDVDAVLFSEVGQRAVGMMAGAREGARQFARTLATGEPSDLVTKVEARTQEAIGGRVGSVIRTPTRFLAAEDEFFKAVARRMELHGLAVRQVRREGLRGAEARARVAELAANPTDDMMAAAFDYGRYLTFQRPLGAIGQSVSRVTQAAPILKLVLPFVRTPTNILKFAAERSPFAPLLGEWRADFRAGGARRDLAVARVAVGSGFGMLVAEAAAQGLITGSPPTDRGRADMLAATGWQPYSVLIGGTYYSYKRLDPYATTIGVAADMATRFDTMTEREREDAATRFVAGFLANLSDKTWLSGFSDLMQAIQDPGRNARGFINRLIGSMAVPTGVAQVARAMDGTPRVAETPADAIRARLPGASQALPPRRDVLGRVWPSQNGFATDLLSPVWQSQDRNDPVAEALAGNAINIGRPNRTIGGERLSAGRYDRYQQLIGEAAYPLLTALVSSPRWSTMSQAERTSAVEATMRVARADARRALFGGPVDDGANAPPRVTAPLALPSPRRAGGAIPPPPPGFELVP